MKEMKDANGIVNRHIARLLSDLEDAGCPAIFRDAVKAELQWLRSDLNELEQMKELKENDNR